MSKLHTREWLLSQKKIIDRSLFKGIARKISFISGKGGVGKTSIAVKMSCLLSQWGHRVLLFDCDYNLSNGVVKLGLPINENFYSLVSSERSFQDCLYKEGNLHILSGCNGNLEIFEKGLEFEKIVMDIIASHESEYDYIVLDCAAGLGKDMMALGAYCDDRVIVVTPDKSSLTDSYSLIKILGKKYKVMDNYLLVNKVSSLQQYKRIVKSMCETVERFLSGHLHILGSIGRETETVDKFDSLLLKNAHSKIHRDISHVTKRFTEEHFVSSRMKTPSEREHKGPRSGKSLMVS